MKLRSLLSLAIVLAILSSCGINDLEDRLDNVEHALGSDEPIKFNFKTTNYDDQEVVKNASYFFKSIGWNSSYLYDYEDGTYYVYIERYSDVFGENSAYIEFYYDANTNEVSNEGARVYFYAPSGDYINPYFSPDNTGNTVTINVKSFNPESGAINVSVDASTDATAENNEYEGEPMTCSFTFSGKLEKFVD